LRKEKFHGDIMGSQIFVDAHPMQVHGGPVDEVGTQSLGFGHVVGLGYLLGRVLSG
jgi:hypothetical protein